MISTTANISVEFESIHTIEDELNYMLDKKGLSLSAGESTILKARELVKRHFMDAWDELNPMTQFYHKRIRIVIHYEANDSANGVLAYFNLGKSKENDASVMVFGVYLNTVTSYLEAYVNNNDYKAIGDGVWQHEIIHMLDFAKLEIRNQMCQDDVDEYLKMDVFKYSKLEMSISDSMPPHWLFLNSLANLRDEGIPRLYEYMSGYSSAEINNLEKAIECFHLYYGSLNHYLLKNSLSAQEGAAFHHFLEEFQRVSYAIGPWFVINALSNLPKGDLACDIEQIIQEIKSGCIVSPQHRLMIVQKALELDFGAYLIFNSNGLFASTDPYFFDADDLLMVSGAISREYKDSAPHQHFVKSMHEAVTLGDEKSFVALLTDVMGCAMSDDEIQESFHEFEDSLDQSFYITSRLSEKVKSLMLLWNQEQNDLLRWVLTYVFDPSDTLDDSLNLIGYIDDMYVIYGWERIREKELV